MENTIVILALILFSSAYSSAQTFTLKSNDLSGQATEQQVFNGFGCEGENISPQLSWENAPEGTKSFAITVYDGDAPTGSGWWHWLIFDIDPSVTSLAAKAGSPTAALAPKGAIQSKTDYGTYGYGGPCPPVGHGLHKYEVTVHALKVDKLGLDKEANAAVVGYYIGQNTIGKATLVFYHQR